MVRVPFCSSAQNRAGASASIYCLQPNPSSLVHLLPLPPLSRGAAAALGQPRLGAGRGCEARAAVRRPSEAFPQRGGAAARVAPRGVPRMRGAPARADAGEGCLRPCSSLSFADGQRRSVLVAFFAGSIRGLHGWIRCLHGWIGPPALVATVLGEEPHAPCGRAAGWAHTGQSRWARPWQCPQAGPVSSKP